MRGLVGPRPLQICPGDLCPRHPSSPDSVLPAWCAGLRGCRSHAHSPPTSILSRLPGLRSWSTPVSHSPPREAPWSSNPSSYPLERTAGDIAQLSLPRRGAAFSEEPQLLTAEPLSPCPGFPWPRLSVSLEPPHLERWDRLGRGRRIPRPPPALAARSRPLSEPGEPTQAHPQAQSLCERAPYARSRARAHPLAPTT